MKQANNCFEMIRDTIGQAYVLRDLGRAYTVTQQLIDAIEVYREALPYAPAMGNGTIPNELANIYLEKGEYEVAAKYIDQALRLFRTEESRFPTHLVLGKYYLETAQIDSSEYYLQKALSSPSLQTHAGALKYLSYVKEKQSAWIESITLNKRYEACRDSIDRIVETESIRRMDYFYNYQKIQEALYQSQIKVMKKDKERYLYALIICACVFISLGIYSYWRRREKEIKNQKEILEQTIEKQRQNNLRIKEESAKQETPATPEKEVVTEDKTVEASKNTEVKAGSIAIDETHFPDKVFREQIIAEFDKDGDSVLSVDEISKAQFLNLHGMKTISSLEGIQYLTNLQSLDVSTTSVSDLSPVKNSSLKRLDCRSSKVGSVDLTRYPNLEAFLCDNTSINSLDVSKNEKLNTLFADSTSISNLDVTNNPNLEQLSCSNTGLMELDVTHNPQLVTLDIGDTKVKTLDISKNPNLKQLSCYMTNIAELDVTKNTKLTRLFCHDTTIKKLDLSNNLELEMLRCGEIFEQGIRGLDISKNTKIKKLICDDLYWLNVGENKVLENNHAFVGNGYIDIKGNKIDLKKDVEQGIDISKVKVTANGTLDKDTGIITVDDVKKPVTYEYDCGTYKDGNVVLKVELSLNSQGEDNTAPTISANDVTLNVGDTFDPLANVTATDKEDGTITLTKDNIVANDVDTSKAGTYHVTYKVTDKNGASAKKTITVTVKQNTGDLNSAPIISANDVTLNVGDTFDPLANVTATDKEDGTIILTKDNIIANDVDTSKAGTYHVTFRVVDKNGAITEKTITVTVKEKATNKPVSPQQPQKPSKPTTPTKPSGQKNPVKTGDMTNVGLFTSMFAGSTGVLAVLFGKKRKRNKNN